MTNHDVHWSPILWHPTRPCSAYFSDTPHTDWHAGARSGCAGHSSSLFAYITCYARGFPIFLACTGLRINPGNMSILRHTRVNIPRTHQRAPSGWFLPCDVPRRNAPEWDRGICGNLCGSQVVPGGGASLAKVLSSVGRVFWSSFGSAECVIQNYFPDGRFQFKTAHISEHINYDCFRLPWWWKSLWGVYPHILAQQSSNGSWECMWAASLLGLAYVFGRVDPPMYWLRFGAFFGVCLNWKDEAANERDGLCQHGLTGENEKNLAMSCWNWLRWMDATMMTWLVQLFGIVLSIRTPENYNERTS